MNIVTLIGRITKDPEIRYSTGANPVAFGNYTLAVDRDKEITDFILCKVVGKPAEFVEKYLRKGVKIAVNGSIQVDNYKDRDGNSRSTTYVQVQRHEFCESKASQAPAQPTPASVGDGFMSIPDGVDDEDLPFN